MNPWHLLWIIPLSACVGFMFAAILAAGGEADRARESEERHEQAD